MKRIPSGLALLLLVPVAAGVVALSILAGPTALAGLTRDIVLEYRLPRGILAFLVGASLGASGVCFQGLFRNALADPFVVGVSSGAALGAVGAIVLGLETTMLGLAPATATAFLGATAAAFLAYGVARVRGRVPVTTLLLAGSAIGAFAGAMVSILILINSPKWSEVVSWLMGSMSHPDPWNRVKVVVPCLIASAIVMLVHARDLNLLLLGEESAQQLGVEVERLKLFLLAAGSLAAAGAVATCRSSSTSGAGARRSWSSHPWATPWGGSGEGCRRVPRGIRLVVRRRDAGVSMDAGGPPPSRETRRAVLVPVEIPWTGVRRRAPSGDGSGRDRASSPTPSIVFSGASAARATAGSSPSPRGFRVCRRSPDRANPRARPSGRPSDSRPGGC